MPTHVYANNNEVASKAADGKSIAAFPDVCFSPPAPPVGPMPLPYPNTGEVKDTDSGTAKVFVKDKMSGMADDSHMTKSMGDEAATKSQGKGLINGGLQGKCYFKLWSMDVQMEGKGVPRNIDLVSHNHACETGNGGIQSHLDDKTDGKAIESQSASLKTFCYHIYVVDHNRYFIKSSDFSSPHKKHTNSEGKILDSTATKKGEELKQGTYFHKQPGKLFIQLSPRLSDIKSLLYNRYCLDKDTSRNKIEDNIDTTFSFLGPAFDSQLVNFSQECCSVSTCEGHSQQYLGVITPSPHFPILNSESWDRTTAYNLAVLSDVAYGDLAQNENGTFKGSLLDITENLLVPFSQCGLNDNQLELAQTDYNDNFIYCNEFSCQNTGSYGNIMADNKTIVISFRGTQFEFMNKTVESIKDILIDVSIKDLIFCNAKTHAGYCLGYTSVSADIYAQLKKIDTKNKCIYITGHSLGGALALLCAADLYINHKFTNIAVYTYGMPAVFADKEVEAVKLIQKKFTSVAFTQYSDLSAYEKHLYALEEIKKIKHYRHTMSDDLVPKIIDNVNMHPHPAVCLDTDRENGHPILDYIYALKNYSKIKQQRINEEKAKRRANEMEGQRKWAENNCGMDQLANVLSR